MAIVIEAIKEEYESLKKLLHKYIHNYYVLDNSIVTDEEYDLLYKKLLQIEAENPNLITKYSPSQRVGAKPLETLKQITHKNSMYSLDNSVSDEDLDDFDKKIREDIDIPQVEYVSELKIDGLAISIVYEKGYFIQGATRGDGKVGEDVSLNLKTINSIPLNLNACSTVKVPEWLEVRGEVFLPRSNFDAMNKEQEKEGKKLFANARNAASGSLKQLDPANTAKRKLDAFIYMGIVEDSEIKFSNHYETLEYLKKLGFKVNTNTQLCKNIEEVKTYCKDWKVKKTTLDYDTDGIVVKTNNLEYQRILGFTAKSPKWATAFKYPPEQAITKIENIIIQVGRLGTLTPVAVLTPVNVSGSTISRATLHNYEELKKKNIKIGDSVIIHKAGEIIPEVLKVLEEMRDGSQIEVEIPSVCPICKGQLEQETEALLRCINKNCLEQVKQRIRHFVSRDAMNIEGIGDSLIEQLVNNDLIKDFSDLYTLNISDISKLERMGEKSASNIITSLNNSKSPRLFNFIYALGVKHVGKETASLLDDTFQTLENLTNSELETLKGIENIGITTAESIFNYFRDIENLNILCKLKDYGVIPKQRSHIDIENSNNINSDLLKGLRFVFTGSLSKITRDQGIKEVELRGGKISSSVSKSTSYLVLGDEPGSKFEKAKSLNIKILTEDEFLELISK